MRGVNFYLILVVGMMLPGLAGAIDQTEKPVRADLQNEFMSKPITAKKLYREAWHKDNLPQMSIIEQMEYAQKHMPELDEDMKIIMQSGMELMKKMHFGLEKKDITESAASIEKNPAEAIQSLSENAMSDVTLADVISAATETIEPGRRLMEKIYRDKSLGRVTYTIDVDSF